MLLELSNEDKQLSEYPVMSSNKMGNDNGWSVAGSLSNEKKLKKKWNHGVTLTRKIIYKLSSDRMEVFDAVISFLQVFVWIGEGANEVEKAEAVTVAMVTYDGLISVIKLPWRFQEII